MVCSVIGVPKSIDNDILLVSTRSVTPRAPLLSLCPALEACPSPLLADDARVHHVLCVCACMRRCVVCVHACAHARLFNDALSSTG